jgi:hypothetical protein
MKYAHAVLAGSVLFILFGCSGPTENSQDTSLAPGSSSVETTVPASVGVLSSLEKPLPPLVPVATEGWNEFVVNPLGRVSIETAMAYDTDIDPNLDYLLVEFSGINNNGKKANIYGTIHACVPSGSVSANGKFRQLIIGSDSENRIGGLDLVTTGDDEVLDGFKDAGRALYGIERGDTGSVIMGQSQHCGYEHDLVVTLGDISLLPILK